MSFKEFKEYWVNVFAVFAEANSGVDIGNGKKIILGGEPMSTFIVEGAGAVEIKPKKKKKKE